MCELLLRVMSQFKLLLKTAVIYARYSSDSQTEQSIEGQLRVCKDYAQRNEITIVKNIWCCYKNHFTKD